MCDIDQWPMWADMIRSDQMTHQQVMEFLDDHPAFAAWYEGQWVNTIGYENSQAQEEEKLVKWAEDNPDNDWVQEQAVEKIRALWKKDRK